MRRIAIVLSLTFAAAACGGPGRSARAALARGDAYADSGRSTAALIEYRNAVKLAPSWRDARRKLAKAWQEAGRLDEAYAEYSRLVDMNPQDTAARLDTGHVLLAARMYDEARMRAEEVLDREPQNMDARILLGDALAGLGRVQDAIEQLQPAAAFDHTGAVSLTIGALKTSAGDRGGAEAAYRAAIDIAPSATEPRVAYAQFLEADGRADAAEQELLATVAKHPDDELANRAVAAWYIKAAKPDLAEPYLKRAASRTEEQFQSSVALADFYMSAHRWDDARQVLNGVRRGPQLTPARIRLAAIAFETGDAAQAHARLDAVLHDDPTAEAWTLQAQILEKEGKKADATTALHRALDVNPTFAPARAALDRLDKADKLDSTE